MRGKIGYHGRSHLPGGSDPTLNYDIGFYDLVPIGGNPKATGSSQFSMSASFAGSGGGTDLLDLTVNGGPTGPSVKRAGMYEFKARLGFVPGGGGTFGAGQYVRVDMETRNETAPQNFWSQSSSNFIPLNNTSVPPFTTVQFCRYIDPDNPQGVIYFEIIITRDSTQSLTIEGELAVQRIY